ncbi:RIP metalloprotease RseP [Brevibacillus daliensis]|uniref:RIP metalloprotease RseP n=1 Tax=Brevibacillus daliensis TaxID=2892995 RepID=UPI001E5EAB75|nr:RIP metalloprotease RseP [Brevibacillus daliensis]
MQLPPVEFNFVSILAFVIVFGLLVFFHELGHFLLAKRAGILCREFALGMGPKIFSYKKNETEYTVRLLPIGGMVRMAGEDPELEVLRSHMDVGLEFNEANQISKIYTDRNKFPMHATVGALMRHDLVHHLKMSIEIAGDVMEYDVHPKANMIVEGKEVQIAPYDRQFQGKTVGQRFWAIFAGPAANFILAFVAFMVGAMLFGAPSDKALIGEVMPGGPAYEAGLQMGDKILAIDGTPLKDWDHMVSILGASANKKLEMKIERDGSQMVVPVQLGEKGLLNVYQGTEKSLWLSMKAGYDQTARFTGMIFSSLGMLFTGEVGVKDLSGPAGIFTMTSQMAQGGLSMLITWTGFLSINLGIFNLLPIPALDGGRLIFIGVEAVRGKPIDPRKEGMVHVIGFALLMMLILIVTWNDIQRLL